MNIIIFFIYMIFLYWMFSKLDNKYHIVLRFQDKNNKNLRKTINFLSIISFALFIISPIWEDYFSFLGIYVRLIKGAIYIPFFFRWYIGNRISEIVRIEKEELKNRKVQLTFCYHCGSNLSGCNICPGCGKELEV